MAITRSDLGILTDDMVVALTILDGYRDCAMHHLIEMSEQNLYLHSQAAVTMFDDILQRAFGERVAHYLIERVLPISTNPPQEILLFMDSEFSQIRTLISPGKRRLSEVKCRLRPYFIMESALQGEVKQPTNSQIAKVIRRMKGNESWQNIFPGVSSLRLSTSGHGLTYSVRFTRGDSAAPVRILRNGEHAEETALIREVNLLDRYSMGLFDLADKIGVGRNKTLALIHHLKLQEDPECFHEFRRKSFLAKCYSLKALEKLREALPNLNIEQIWQDYKTSAHQARS